MSKSLDGVTKYKALLLATQLARKTLAPSARVAKGCSPRTILNRSASATVMVHSTGVPSGTVKSPWLRWTRRGNPV